MVVVSDSSPLIALVNVGHVEILPALTTSSPPSPTPRGRLTTWCSPPCELVHRASGPQKLIHLDPRLSKNSSERPLGHVPGVMRDGLNPESLPISEPQPAPTDQPWPGRSQGSPMPAVRDHHDRGTIRRSSAPALARSPPPPQCSFPRPPAPARPGSWRRIPPRPMAQRAVELWLRSLEPMISSSDRNFRPRAAT